MMFLKYKLFKTIIILLAVFLSNSALLQAAAGDKKDSFIGLTHTTKQEYLGGIPYKKEVAYFLNDTYVGCILYGASGQDFGRIDLLSIKKNFRSQGIGSHILQQAMRDLENTGYKKVRLKAEPLDAMNENYGPALERLIEFYKKNGFTVLTRNTVKAIMEASFE